MKINEYHLAHTLVGGECTDPAVGESLSAYVADPVGDPAAEDVEDHLLECRHCREFFLTMLRLQDEAHGAAGVRQALDAKVPWFSAFGKEWP